MVATKVNAFAIVYEYMKDACGYSSINKKE
jgi:hypothetical protein